MSNGFHNHVRDLEGMIELMKLSLIKGGGSDDLISCDKTQELIG